MISIITPVFNMGDLTAQYLYTHNIHYPHPPDIEWIIIDNGSTDGTGGILEYWKDIFGPPLRVLKNSENRGFAIACNQGAREAEGNIFVFLNNDIIVQGDYITAIEKTLTGSLIIGPQLIDSDTGWNVFGGKVISYLAGWCLAMTRSTYEQLGGFDERFSPAYYEDVDLCYNALKQGYGLQQARLPLQHLGERTGLAQLENRNEITLANRVRFAKKWGLKL